MEFPIHTHTYIIDTSHKHFKQARKQEYLYIFDEVLWGYGFVLHTDSLRNAMSNE